MTPYVTFWCMGYQEVSVITQHKSFLHLLTPNNIILFNVLSMMSIQWPCSSFVDHLVNVYSGSFFCSSQDTSLLHLSSQITLSPTHSRLSLLSAPLIWKLFLCNLCHITLFSFLTPTRKLFYLGLSMLSCLTSLCNNIRFYQANTQQNIFIASKKLHLIKYIIQICVNQ